MVLISGIASTSRINHHEKVLSHGLDIAKPYPPLCFDHDKSRVIGRIVKLERVGDKVRIEAEVEDAYASLPAFSIAYKAHKFVMRRAGREDYFAEIQESSLTEISLVERPANKDCCVSSRKELVG